MIESKLKTDPTVRYLLKRSSFTKVQLDTYYIDRTTSGEKVSLKVKIKMRDRKNVSKGAFLHTLRQAQENLQRAIYTLILAEYIGLLEEGSTSKLIQIGSLLKNVKEEITEESAFKISKIIESVVEMVSGRRK
ncbi:MAG: hypothetical protein H3Z49_03715 [archaeon]|nr:hypothetical protein [archaeon]